MADVLSSLPEVFDAVGAVARARRQHAEEMRALLLGLLDVADSLDRLRAGPAESAAPFDLLAEQLAQVLRGQGVVPLDCLGAAFDPPLHEAVGRRPSPEPAGTVVERVSRGYLWRGELLRAARVVVAGGGPAGGQS